MHLETLLAELHATFPNVSPHVLGPKDTALPPPLGNPVAYAVHHSQGPYPSLEVFLREAVQRDEAILVLVNDLDRATDTATAVQALHNVITTSGLAPSLHFLVATGSHGVPANTARPAAEQTIFGSMRGWVADRLSWHHADQAEVAALKLPDGEVVYMNRLVLDHTYLLPIGSMEPHYFAGVTGPHKTVTIGVLSRASIERNHAGALHPNSRILACQGNPVYDGIMRMIAGLQASGKKLFAINEILNQHGQILWCAAGALEPVLQAGMPMVERLFVHRIAAPVDLLVLHVKGPLAKNLYQADKGIKNNEWVVRDGGRILLLADCPEGVGIDHFMRLLATAPDLASAQATVTARGYRLGDHKAVKLRALTDPRHRNVQVGVVTKGLDAESARLAGMTQYPAVTRALQALTDDLDRNTLRLLVVEDAGNVTVHLQQA
jgi:nickel-dependent lactate racemase